MNNTKRTNCLYQGELNDKEKAWYQNELEIMDDLIKAQLAYNHILIYDCDYNETDDIETDVFKKAALSFLHSKKGIETMDAFLRNKLYPIQCVIILVLHIEGIIHEERERTNAGKETKQANGS